MYHNFEIRVVTHEGILQNNDKITVDYGEDIVVTMNQTDTLRESRQITMMMMPEGQVKRAKKKFVELLRQQYFAYDLLILVKCNNSTGLMATGCVITSIQECAEPTPGLNILNWSQCRTGGSLDDSCVNPDIDDSPTNP